MGLAPRLAWSYDCDEQRIFCGESFSRSARRSMLHGFFRLCNGRMIPLTASASRIQTGHWQIISIRRRVPCPVALRWFRFEASATCAMSCAARVTAVQVQQHLSQSATRVQVDRIGSRQISSSGYNRNRTAFVGAEAGSAARTYSSRGNSSLSHIQPTRRSSEQHGV